MTMPLRKRPAGKGEPEKTRGRSRSPKAPVPKAKAPVLKRPAKAPKARSQKAPVLKRPAKVVFVPLECAEEQAEEEDLTTDECVVPPEVRGTTKPMKASPLPVSEKPPTSSQLPFHDFSDEVERRSFRSAAGQLRPGMILCARLYNNDTSFDTEAVFKVGSSKDFAAGPVVEAEFIGSDKAPADARASQMKLSGQTLLHLCKKPDCCGDFQDDPNLLHVGEWKICLAEQVDHAWVTASMRKKLFAAHAPSRVEASARVETPPLGDFEQEVDTGEDLPALPDRPPEKARRSKGGSTADAFGVPCKTDAEAQAAEFHARESWPVPPPVAPPPKTALERLWSKAKGAEPDKEPTQTLASGIAIAELKERLVEERKKSAEAEARAAAAKDRRSRSKVSAHGKDKERAKSRRGSSKLLDTLAANKDKKGGRRNAGSTSDKESARSEERPKHRRKHSKKDRRGRRRSSSSSSSSSLSADELFHGAGGGNGLASKLVKVARRHPGKLLGKTLEAMNTTLTPGAGPLGEKKPAIMFQYLQKALAARRSDPRAERELTTVALAVDNILKGNLEEALDILAQRFKRVEAEDSGALHRDLAERLEVIPEARITSLSLDEQEEVANMDRKWRTYKDGRAKSPRR